MRHPLEDPYLIESGAHNWAALA